MLIVSLSQVYSIQLVPNEITDYWRRSSLRLWVRTCQEWLFRNFLLYFLPWPLLLLVPPEWMCWSCQGPFWYHCWHVFSWLQSKKVGKISLLMHWKQSCLRSPFDSIRLAVLTASPKRQYLGIFTPTTPAQQGPEKANSQNSRTTQVNVIFLAREVASAKNFQH